MKKLFFLITLTLGMLQAYAQTDSVKIEQFCQVIAVPRLLKQ